MPGSADTLTFSEYLAALRGRSAATTTLYAHDVADFERFCATRGQRVSAALTPTTVGLYLMERMEERRRREDEAQQLSARSAARAVSALKAYSQYLVFRGELKENPIAAVQAPKYSRRLPAYYSVEEILALLRAWDNEPGALALRNSALLAVLYGCGLRVSECAGLGVSDVRLDEGMLRVLGKGRKQREVPCGQGVRLRLERYISFARPQLVAAGKAGAALWLSRRGTALGVRAIAQMLDLSALKAGFVKPVSPHKLRHACATHMMEGGADVRLLQDFLGHESINTTQIYTQVTRTQLREVYESAHPRARRTKH